MLLLANLLLHIAIRLVTSASVSESWAMLSGRVSARPSCAEIPVNFTLCHGIDYPRMRLPNLLDHDTLEEAATQAQAWVPLLRLHCHTDAQLFLCSLFAPVCLDRPIFPCQSLCLAVKHGCEKRMIQYGFPWPDMLNCNKFPVKNDMCIQPRAVYRNQSCSSCNQIDTYENILDNYCRSEYVMKVKISDLSPTHLIVKRSRSLKRRSADMKMMRAPPIMTANEVYFNADKASCPCHIDEADRRKRFLIMANPGPLGPVANLIMPWKKERSFRKAVRMFRKLNCKTLGTEIRERARREKTRRYQRFSKKRHHVF